MAVILPGKGRGKAKRRTASAKKRKKVVKPRSATAASLADPRYRKRVVKSAKAYSRKTKVEEDEDL
ncbi:MAG: hypothetical protein ACR2GC_01260 [Methyloceanibacter sp.]|uniref:hypothetical protein n=1 Tax=Methyloceanibacter sp. TaxID=1965321 RepID=UPI003D9BAB37